MGLRILVSETSSAEYHDITSLQLFEQFREQVFQLCVKMLDPQEKNHSKELVQLCCDIGDIEGMIYCTRKLVPHRYNPQVLGRFLRVMKNCTEEESISLEDNQDLKGLVDRTLEEVRLNIYSGF
eukprot:jgi/Galph1/2048/GphlegSOOS_G720.1